MFFPDFEERPRIEKPPFPDDGFVTGDIILPALDIPLCLNGKEYFKFDGVVPNMWKYLKSLSRDMRFFTDKYIGDPKYRTAFNAGLVWNDCVGRYMAVKHVSPRADLSNIAHEAAEIAFQFGYGAILEQHLEDYGLPHKTIVGLESHEVGTIAGVLIPRSKGLSVDDLYQSQDPQMYNKLVKEGYIPKI